MKIFPRLKGERGTGRTREQMKNAPEKSVFVWVNSHLDYPKNLAKEINRGDLQIVPPFYLEDETKFHGKTLSGIIIDHAADLTEKQTLGFWTALNRIKAQKPK